MASPWTSYDFDPEAGDGVGAYTFSDGKSTRTVANTAFAAQLAADIDAASGKSRSLPTTAAEPFGGAAPASDPMAGVARAEQAAAARVAPEWQPAQTALTGSAPAPDPMAGMAAAERVLAARNAPAARPDPGAGLAPEAAQAARAIGTAPAPIDMDALTRRLEAVGKRPEPSAVTAAPAVGLASPDDRWAMETGYQKRGPFDFRRFLVDGPPVPDVKSEPVPAPRMGTTTLYDAATGAAIGTSGAGSAHVALPAVAPRDLGDIDDPNNPNFRKAPPNRDLGDIDDQSNPNYRTARPQFTLPDVEIPAPSAVRVGGPPKEDPNIALIRSRGAQELGFQDRQNEIDQGKSSGMAGFQEEIAIKAAENQDALDKLRENQQRAERTLLDERNEAAKEVFAKQYDPDRFWKQRPAAGLLATIAVALGELGRGLQRSNGPNIGLTLVNQAIERDLDAQREEYARAKDKLGVKNNAYAELRAKGLTDAQAMNAAHAQQLSLVDQRIKLFTANSDDEQMKLRGDMLRAGVQNATVDKERAYRAEVERQAALRLQAQYAQQDKQRKDQIKEALDLARIAEMQSNANKNNADARGNDTPNPERIVGLPPSLGVPEGTQVEIKNPTLHTKVAEAVPEVAKFSTLVDDVVRIGNGLADNNPAYTSAQLQSAIKELQLTYKGPAFAQLGVLAGPDLDMIDGALPTPGGIFKKNASEALQAVKGRALTKLDNTLRAAGARPVVSQQYQDQNGNVRYATGYAAGPVVPVSAPPSLRKVGQ